MKCAKRWRYTCDFCRKTGGQRHTMEKHERGCTLNPNRVCGICRMRDLTSHSMPDLKVALAVGFHKLRELSEECPACILATLRQTTDFDNPFVEDGRNNFDFKSEMASMWNEINSARSGAQGEYY